MVRRIKKWNPCIRNAMNGRKFALYQIEKKNRFDVDFFALEYAIL